MTPDNHGIVFNHCPREQIVDKTRAWMEKNGSPTLARSVTFSRVEGAFLPYWLLFSDVSTRWSGFEDRPVQGEFQLAHHWLVEAGAAKEGVVVRESVLDSDGYFLGYGKGAEASRDVDFSRIAKPFDPGRVPADMPVIPERMPLEEAERTAQAVLEAEHRRLAAGKADRLDGVESSVRMSSAMLLHIPVWTLEYEFGGRRYNVRAAGFNGNVIQGELPKPKGFFSALFSRLWSGKGSDS